LSGHFEEKEKRKEGKRKDGKVWDGEISTPPNKKNYDYGLETG